MMQVTPGMDDILNLDVSFDSNVVDQIQMQRLLQQLQHVVAQLQKNRETKLQDIEVISPQDNKEILAWNKQPTIYPLQRSCIHDLVQRHALQRPDAVAVVSWDGELSYSQLDKLSARLAHHLISCKVGPEVIIPLCFEKSVWTIVGLLAVLKAGGAFILLDPGHPDERLRTIIRELDAPFLLTSAEVALKFTDIETITVCEQLFASIPDASGNPATTVGPDNLACVVFTSGSTGAPKGICLSHYAICTSSQGHGPGLNVTKESRVFQFCSYAFDMAVYDIVTTLQMGGCILVPSEEEKLNRLAETMTSMRANWVFLTPSTLSLLSRDDVPTIETLVTGGEAVSQAIVDEWADKITLFQCSGPAETTTCIFGKMTPYTKKNSLGFPMIPAWIVDPLDHNVLLPIGAIGEMILEGHTLARGYLNKASDSWIEDPIWSQGQSQQFHDLGRQRRMYKTGDLVQYDSNGRLAFIGRKDNQVKLRGQRIEMSEVEDAIRSVTSISFPFQLNCFLSSSMGNLKETTTDSLSE